MKANERPKFVLNLWRILDFRSSNKKFFFQNLSISYTWKDKRQQYKKNKLKIIVLTWNEEFQTLYGSYSVSDI